MTQKRQHFFGMRLNMEIGDYKNNNNVYTNRVNIIFNDYL